MNIVSTKLRIRGRNAFKERGKGAAVVKKSGDTLVKVAVKTELFPTLERLFSLFICH